MVCGVLCSYFAVEGERCREKAKDGSVLLLLRGELVGAVMLLSNWAGVRRTRKERWRAAA